MRIASWFSMACGLAASWIALPANAQGSAMPSSRPITLIVTIAPGGSMDSLARIYAEKLKDQLQHNVVVENRTGAGAALGTEYVARSAPDGHTILLMDTSPPLQDRRERDCLSAPNAWHRAAVDAVFGLWVANLCRSETPTISLTGHQTLHLFA